MSKQNKYFFAIFITFWIALTVLNFIVPNRSFSENENRMLAKLPKFEIEELLNGKYVEKLDNYINDQFVFRDTWLRIKSMEEMLLGKTENNGVYIGKDGYLFEKIKYTQTSEKKIKTLVEKINNFRKDTNITTYFMLVPNSIYINQDKLPKFAETFDQKEVIKNAYSMTSDIHVINTVDTLMQNKDKYIFFKTDHHITSDGAYLLYLEFCKEANITPVTDYTKEEVTTSFLGSFDSKAQVANQKEDTIVVYKNSNNTEGITATYDKETTNSIFNEEFLNKKDKYSYFLNGNNAKVVVKTKQTNGKKLLVVKDSYSHIMAQFLCQNFEEIHFIDPRYYTDSIEEYAKGNNITDTMFLYNVANII